MGDMLFEQFLKELIDNDIQELNAILTYRGVSGILREFESWLAFNDWLRDVDERERIKEHLE